MNDEKRYYWLKLHDDFFSSKRIKKLRKLGSDFLIIYLKMQLLSVRKGGKIEFTGIEDNFAEEIALDIDEDSDKVQLTISYLQSCGLLELNDNNEYLLPYVEKCTGSETSTAKRVRAHRTRQKLLHCNENVTPLKQNDNGEKEIEKEIDIELEKDKELELDKEKDKNKKTSSTLASASAVYFPADELLNNAFIEFVKMRKAIKKPLTVRAAELATKKLITMSNGNNDLAIAICEQSVLKSWQDFYPLKNDTSRKPELSMAEKLMAAALELEDEDNG